MKTTRFPPTVLSQFDPEADETQSPAVKSVIRYQIDGHEFPTFAAAIEHRETKIERFVQPMIRTLDPARAANAIPAIQWLLDNRAELRALLDY